MDQNNRTDRRNGEQEPPRTRKSRSKTRLLSNPWAYLLFVFGTAAILAALCWTAANDVLATNKTEHSAVITVRAGDSSSRVVN